MKPIAAIAPKFSWRSLFSGLLLVLAFLDCAVVVALAEASPKPSPVLAAIRERGEINIGLKTDFAPFGMLDSKGQPVGFEVDLAKRIAAELGVKLKTISVTTENRFQRLEQGAVDLIIATAGDTKERRELATAIEPNYYGAGVNVFLRPEAGANDWQGIRGKNVCALQGAYFNRQITQRYILDLQMYRSVRDALLAVKDGRCIGFLYTDVAIREYLKQPEWEGYKMSFQSALVIPWAVSIHRVEAGSSLDVTLGDLLARFHREGVFVELARPWGLADSRFLQDTRALWNLTDELGQDVCVRNASGSWPAQCRNQAFITSSDVSGLQGVGIFLRDTLGINLSVIYDPFDRGRLLKGIFYTLLLCVVSGAIALLTGVLGAIAIHGRASLVGGAVRIACSWARTTPPLLQMYMLYFGVGSILAANYSVIVSPLIVALITLSLYHGAIILSAVSEALPQIEKPKSGSRFNLHTVRLALEKSTVGVKSALSNLVKATSVASAISVPEMLSATTGIIADQGNVHAMMGLLMVTFYVISTIWMFLIVRGEAWLLNRDVRHGDH